MVNTIGLNKDSLDRLRRFAAAVTHDQLRREVGAGWTVAALLLHVAFWDRRASLLLARWTKSGVEDSPIDSDIVNDSVKDILLAVPPEAAPRLALAAAEEVDRAIAGLAPSILSEIEGRDVHVRLDRAHHRNMHLDEIEKALGAGRQP
ncbi:MAG TPA: maleylpyruvate isomerase N-terminal domain-containing protein [Anaerolineales bacterium]|nr:maleylpyruvate isomerase N-terminal domain-containing protein [Anaerolineales bacterium]